MPTLLERFQSGWNAFMNRDPTDVYKYSDSEAISIYRPDRPKLSRGSERSIITTVFNRIAIDVASTTIEHVRLDENDRFVSVIDSGLNNCLTVEANKDQTGRAFIQDIVMSMFDEGCIAVVPVDTTKDPERTDSYDIRSMRVGKILEWRPNHVKVLLYNDHNGKKEELLLQKATVAIIENPFFAIMNEPNSTMQRLIRKFSLLDIVDEQTGSGKLDMIIQLPYIIKTDARRTQAENRRKDIEMQLASSKYGIAYTDGTEKITQLNRPLENKLLSQVEYLTNLLYSQLGITVEILNGTADEKTMLNYHNRIIEPTVSAIVDEMKRKFLTKTARSQKQSIYYFKDPFKLTPVSDLAEIADKFTRNEIMSSNEFRQIIGMKPSDNPRADELANKNLYPEQQQEPMMENQNGGETGEEMDENDYLSALGELDEVDADLNNLEKELGHSDDELMHYASKYYDPEKAHEYYLKTRELKGRRSTSQLNEEGRAAAEYAKANVNMERDRKIQQHRDQTNAKIESRREQMTSDIASNREETSSKISTSRAQMKAQIEEHTSQAQAKIDQLRNRLKNLSSQGRRTASAGILAEIDKIRESNSEKRAELQEAFSNTSAGMREDLANKNASEREKFGNDRASLNAKHVEKKKKITQDYEEKYLKELDQIKKDARYQKAPSAKKSSGKAKAKAKATKQKSAEYKPFWWR